MNLARQMLVAVSDFDYVGDDPDGDFAEGALAILTAALGKLPEARRQRFLNNIEDGELRERVDTFVTRCTAAARARSSPYPRAGNGHAA